LFDVNIKNDTINIVATNEALLKDKYRSLEVTFALIGEFNEEMRTNYQINLLNKIEDENTGEVVEFPINLPSYIVVALAELKKLNGAQSGFKYIFNELDLINGKVIKLSTDLIQNSRSILKLSNVNMTITIK
jgi:hypothetical protein